MKAKLAQFENIFRHISSFEAYAEKKMTAWIFLLGWLLFSFGVHTALFGGKKNSIIAWAISALTIMFCAALLLNRGDMGIDWDQYNQLYDLAHTLGELISGSWLGLHFEPGFQAYLGFLKTFSLTSNWIPLGLYIISLIIILNKVRNLSLPPIPVVVMHTLLIYPGFFEQIRMAFVYSLGVYIAIKYFFENKKSYLLIVVASLFQYIGIFYFLLLLIANTKKKLSKYVGSIRGSIFYFVFILSVLFVGIFGQKIFDTLVVIFTIFPENIITYKFISYYDRIGDVELSYRGTYLMSIMMLFMIFRLRLSENESNGLISAFGLALWFAIIIFLSIGHFNVLSHRLISMILYPAATVLMVVLSLRSRRDFYIGFIGLTYGIYIYYKMVIHVGPYY